MSDGLGGAGGLGAALVLLIALAAYALPHASAAPQFTSGPDGWAYRTNIILTSSSNLTDYQVPFNFNTSVLISAGKMRSDCGDLRIRTTAGADVPHWIESGCNTTQTKIWMRAPSALLGNTTYHVYYGNPGATSAASPNATFIADSIILEGKNCDPALSGASCPITSHTTADNVRDRVNDLCLSTTTKIDYGFACWGSTALSNNWDRFGVEYRFLFVPDVTGTWTFETRADNWSELATSVSDETLVVSHSLIVTNYGDVHTALTGTLAMTAGQGRWLTFVASDSTGVEEQRLRIQRPGGSLLTASTANFPGMFFIRDDIHYVPTVTTSQETSVFQPPTGSAMGYIGQNNVTANFTVVPLVGGLPQSGATCRIQWSVGAADPWTTLATLTSDASGVCTMSATHTGLAANTTVSYRAYATKTGFGDGMPLYLNATTWGPPQTPVITGTPRANHSQTIQWTATANGAAITGYQVYVNTSTMPATRWATLAPGVTSYSATNLTNGVVYTYRVLATSALGDSPLSAAVSRLAYGPPNPPTITSATAGNHSAALVWTPGADQGSPLQGYRIWIAGVFLTDVAAPATSYNVSNLTNGNTYGFNITAANEDGWSDSSAFAYVTPGARPDPPGALTATRGNGNVTLSWTPGSNNGIDLTGYHIWAGTSSANTFLAATTTNGTNTSFQLNGLTNGVTYFFNLSALNAYGESSSSNEVSAKPATIPQMGSMSHNGANRSIETYFWNVASNGGEPVTGFHVYVGTSQATAARIATVSASNTSFTINGLTNGVNYWFNITPQNAVGNGTGISGNATPGTRPDPPGSLAATRGDGSVSLTWVRGQSYGWNLTAHRIWRGTASGAATLLATVGGANTSFFDDEVANGVTYYYNVTAQSAFASSYGNSSYEVSAKPATTPSAPTLTSAVGTNNTITIGWTPGYDGGEPIDLYNVYESQVGTGDTLVYSGPNTTASFTRANGVGYYYYVFPHNAVGWGAFSNALLVSAGAIPYPPGNVTATPGDQNATISWTAPPDNGGRTITHYNVSCIACTPVRAMNTTSLNATLGGLTNGVDHQFVVKAVNSMGASNTITPVIATPRGLPLAPGALTVVPGNRTANLTWTAANGNGASVTSHKVYRDGALVATVTMPTTTFNDSSLVNGQAYLYQVAGINVAGHGANASVSATPASIPDPPQLNALVRGDRSVNLTWTAGNAQGSAISLYRVYRGTDPGATSLLATATATWYNDTNVTNGVRYYYNLTATNAVGTGNSSNERSAIPAAPPAAPIGLTATRGNHSATLAWTAGATNGEPLVGYDILVDGAQAAQTSNGSNTSFTVNGLANGQPYSFQVRARNAVGTGSLGTSASATPAGAPYPPVLATATRGNGTVALAWSLGDANGAARTSTVVLQGTAPDALSVVDTLGGDATNATRTGLTNGVLYYFAIRHANDVDSGNASNVMSARPADVPAAPVALGAARGNNSIILTWTAGATNGEPLVGYDILAGPAGGARTQVAQTTNGSNLTFTVNGLTNGASYDFQVRARNVVGTGALSGVATGTPSGVPNPPLLTTAVRGDGQVTLEWIPGYDQGSPRTATTVFMNGTSSMFAIGNLSGGATNFTRAGLQNGVTYTFAVRHSNVAGHSVLSTSATAKPARAPDRPNALGADFGDANVTLHWSAPTFDGGEPVTGYAILRGPSASDMQTIATIGANTTFVANGLENGVTYFFRVAARNVVGTGAASVDANATPARAPDAPTDLLAQASSRQVSLSWQAPAFDGGRPVANYDVYLNDSLLARIGTNRTYTVEGLADGVSYRFRVAAENLVGIGARSPESSATPLSAPSAPRELTATTFQPDIVLTWEPPASLGGAPVLQYRIYASPTPDGERSLVGSVDGDQLTFTDEAEPATARYYVVRAVNVVAQSDPSDQAMGATPPDPLEPPIPESYRSCTRETATGAVACTDGPSTTIIGVAAGGRHTCASLLDGSVDCWGEDTAGQAADHHPGDAAIAVSAGASHTCILLEAGDIHCYGSDAYGKAITYAGGDAVQVAAGGAHTCFVLGSGEARCEGSNGYGQSAGRLAGVAAVATGAHHTCFLMNVTRVVDCQGINDKGQSADDLTGDAVEVTAGRYHTCVRTVARIVRCWGEIGPIPSSVNGSAVQITSGRQHACALLLDGKVVCWGANFAGQAAGLSSGNAVAIAAGDTHTCALVADASAAPRIVCWGAAGQNDYGQAYAYPSAAGGLSVVPAPSSGSSSSFFLSTNVLPTVRRERIEEA